MTLGFWLWQSNKFSSVYYQNHEYPIPTSAILKTIDFIKNLAQFSTRTITFLGFGSYNCRCLESLTRLEICCFFPKTNSPIYTLGFFERNSAI